MSFKSLHLVLGSIEKDAQWETRRQFQKLLACWNQTVGDVVAAQTRPLSIQRQVLYVATSSSAWAQNLMFERLRILEKLNAHLRKPLVDIRFSAAQWEAEKTVRRLHEAESTKLWKDHPSRIPAPTSHKNITRQTPKDPNSAFQNWAKVMQARSQHLPLCPNCQCPTPQGELDRWSVCSLCATRQFSP